MPKLAHTYSIVAYDPAAQQLGVAVQSHYFSVGSVVPWLEPGVGAVAHAILRRGILRPAGAGAAEGGQDAGAGAGRAHGRGPQAGSPAGGHGGHPRQRRRALTGARCIQAAGPPRRRRLHGAGQPDGARHSLGCDGGSLRADPRRPGRAHCWWAMEAAEAEGGDIRGRQSAALVVIDAAPTGKPWDARRLRPARGRPRRAAGGTAPHPQRAARLPRVGSGGGRAVSAKTWARRRSPERWLRSAPRPT
jgi:hypothetical protein